MYDEDGSTGQLYPRAGLFVVLGFSRFQQLVRERESPAFDFSPPISVEMTDCQLHLCSWSSISFANQVLAGHRPRVGQSALVVWLLRNPESAGNCCLEMTTNDVKNLLAGVHWLSETRR